MARSGSPYSTPRDANHVPLLVAASTTDGITPVVLEADPTTHLLQVSSTGGSAGTQYVEGVTTAPATGNVFLGRYKATPPSLTDGQINGLQLDSAGNLKVTGSLSVGGTTDNSVYTAGSSTGTPAMGFYHSTIDAVTDGRAATVAITTNRASHTNLRNNSGTEVGTSTTPLQVSLANTTANATAVKVDASTTTQPVSGTVTANAGTNLNTSLLALETGGNLAAIKTDVDKIPSQGQALAAASMPVVLTAAQVTSLTPLSTVAVTQSTAAAITAGWPIVSGETADVTGTFTNGTQTTSVTASSLAGYETVTVSINGTYGTGTAVFEGSDDGGTTWYAVPLARNDSATIEYGYTSLTNTNRMWTGQITGLDSFRIRSTAVASGTINVRISISAAATSDSSVVQLGSALPAGSAVIGHVIADSGSTTAVTQATAANLNATVVGTGTFAAQATLQTQTDTVMVGGINVKEINAVAPLMGNGTTGTGSQRVTIASDNTAFTVNATSSGVTASGSSLTASPVTEGGLAKTANPTAVADGQVVNALFDKLGKQVVVGSVRDLKVNQITTITASTSETTVLTAVASTFLDVYGCIVTNTSATAVTVAFKDSTSGTTQFNVAVPAGDTRGFMLPEGGAIKQGTVNNNWSATTQSVSSVIITMLAVKNI